MVESIRTAQVAAHLRGSSAEPGWGGTTAAGRDGAPLDDDGDLLFADEADGGEPHSPGSSLLSPWLVLVVDDDDAVHDVTRLVLRDLQHDGRPLRLLHAYTAAQAMAVLRAEPEVALLLLDVVMESPDAGLRLVETVRDQLGNRTLRILLRTGQPGYAPELEAVQRYEIDGYEVKGTLTAQALTARVVAALRCCALLRQMQRTQTGAEALLTLTTALAPITDPVAFAARALDGLGRVLGGPVPCRFFAPAPALKRLGGRTGWVELAAAGVDARPTGEGAALAAGLAAGQPPVQGTMLPLVAGTQTVAALWMADPAEVDGPDLHLRGLLQASLAVQFGHLRAVQRLVRTHEATVFALADLGEFRDTETGAHVQRVAHTSAAIAARLVAVDAFPAELSTEGVATLGMASALHDIGKVSISDAVLRKPGRLDKDERAAMETHAAVGGRILGRAAAHVGEPSVLSVAEEIAMGHHEWFDGRGYPAGLRGAQIPLSARITAVADVFDALTHARPYKEAWPEDKAVDYITDLSGAQFDPQVVKAFLHVLADAGWRQGIAALGG